MKDSEAVLKFCNSLFVMWNKLQVPPVFNIVLLSHLLEMGRNHKIQVKQLSVSSGGCGGVPLTARVTAPLCAAGSHCSTPSRNNSPTAAWGPLTTDKKPGHSRISYCCHKTAAKSTSKLPSNYVSLLLANRRSNTLLLQSWARHLSS